jgi:uncharacterized protein (DUF305 family)
MTSRTRRTALVVPAVLVAAIVAGCGSSDSTPTSPSTSMPMAMSTPASTTAAGNATDRAFVNDMTPHHRSAIAMAQIALTRAQHPEVKQLARNIIASQKGEIALMAAFTRQLDAGDAGSTLGQSMSAMGMDTDDASLKTAMPFDRAFIDMMRPHHQGAVTMARIELAKGGAPTVKALARRIIAAQTKEIAQMKLWRSQWYGAAHSGSTHGGGSMSMG